MRVYVEYSVPVFVEVDFSDQAVVAVRVDDEQVEGPTTVIALEGGSLSARAASRALAVSGRGHWPSVGVRPVDDTPRGNSNGPHAVPATASVTSACAEAFQGVG